MRRPVRTVSAPLPAQTGVCEGLAYSLWLPAPEKVTLGGVVVLHGAGSCKESHHDYARALIVAGLAAVTFDQRGHGESEGELDGRLLADVATMASLLRSACERPELPIALRGSSMGGCLAILAAPLAGASAVVAICPASPEGLRRGLQSGRFQFEADASALDAVLADCNLHSAMQELKLPVLLMHASGDEQVPVEHSQQLAKHFASDKSRLIVVPGGHHRSIQHDPELQAASVKFILAALAEAPPRAGPQGPQTASDESHTGR
ncbi:MAG TPA: alpha/beta fold hydrolase [Solirubrobacteraceae bacterium]|nr:alpha/beta fold hydrolase [Solirubrobacteraceae bacterium]